MKVIGGIVSILAFVSMVMLFISAIVNPSPYMIGFAIGYVMSAIMFVYTFWHSIENREKIEKLEKTLQDVSLYLCDKGIIKKDGINQYLAEREHEREQMPTNEKETQKAIETAHIVFCKKCGNQIFPDEIKCSMCGAAREQA